jgi:hypothetical protein
VSDPTVYQTQLLFNAIYIIESLPEGDFKSGQSLYDDIVYPRISQDLGGAYTEFSRVQNERELHAKLRQIDSAARSANHLPIIHFEAHGFDQGMELADGALVEWSAITPRLASINEACRMNLIVVAMACQGWNLMYSLMPSERAPLNMLIAPPENMTGGEILEATRRFYDGLVAHLDLNEALKTMNGNLDFSKWRISPGTAEILFCRVFRAYVAGLTEDLLRERENASVANIARARNLDVKQTAILREQIRRDLVDHAGNYERQRHRFLMLDLYPDNSSNLGLTYDRCNPQGSE